MKTLKLALLAAIAMIGVAQVQDLRAQEFKPDPVDETAAKREGAVVWYTSTPLPQAQKIVNLFEKEHGFKVELFRSGGSAILRRFQQEADAGRIAAGGVGEITVGILAIRALERDASAHGFLR